MALFNGQNIFNACYMATQDQERESQNNSFFGINGTESLDGGFRYTATTVTGMHVADDEFALAVIQNTFRSYKDGLAYTLVDNIGVIWYNVKLMRFSPQPPIRRDSLGRCLQGYTAEFMHLSL
jgi:hypothetical protein